MRTLLEEAMMTAIRADFELDSTTKVVLHRYTSLWCVVLETGFYVNRVIIRLWRGEKYSTRNL